MGGSTESPEAACGYSADVSEHVRTADADRLQQLVTNAVQHFTAGGSLADFAQGLGLGSASDIEFIRSIPQNTQDEIKTTILGYIQRVPAWSVLISHEPGDEFAVRTEEDAASRMATLILVAPHH
jgi:hypothetical protein